MTSRWRRRRHRRSRIFLSSSTSTSCASSEPSEPTGVVVAPTPAPLCLCQPAQAGVVVPAPVPIRPCHPGRICSAPSPGTQRSPTTRLPRVCILYLDGRKKGDMDGHIGFHAALRRSYNIFIQELSKQSKQLVRHHLDSVTSTYSRLCYESEMLGVVGSGANSVSALYQIPASPFFLDLSDGAALQGENTSADQENICPNNQQQTTPGKGNEVKGVLRESQLTVPETPSPDQPSDTMCGVQKEMGNCVDMGGRKRHARIINTGRNTDFSRNQNGGLLFASDVGTRTGSAYSEICLLAAQHFARIREVLIQRSVPSTLNSGLLTPCRDRLVVALGVDLFAVNDELFMDMFTAPGAKDLLQNEHQSLRKRQKILQSCLNEFKNIARAL